MKRTELIQNIKSEKVKAYINTLPLDIKIMSKTFIGSFLHSLENMTDEEFDKQNAELEPKVQGLIALLDDPNLLLTFHDEHLTKEQINTAYNVLKRISPDKRLIIKNILKEIFKNELQKD